MNNEKNKILNKILDKTPMLTDLVGLGVAILVTKLAKEFMIITEKVYYLTLQNTYQLVYDKIPANETDALSIVNATYLISLSSLQQINHMLTMLTIVEYLLYFLVFFILLLYVIIKKDIR